MDTIKEIKVTDKYDFTLDEANRPIRPDKVDRMATDMSVHGSWIANFPIIVDSQGNIRDGQHRFLAARRLGYPVHYIVDDSFTIENVAAAARNQDKWTSLDFVHHYASLGLENYIWLKDFQARNPHFKFSAIVNITMVTDNHRVYEKIRDGLYVAPEEYRQYAEDAAALALRLQPFTPALYATRSFQVAIGMMFRHHGFDPDRLVSQFQTYGMTIYRQSLATDYLRELQVVYNYHFKNNRLQFSKPQA